MRHVTIFILFALTPFSTQGAIEIGNYLFLYGQLVGCGDTIYLVDYAEIPENGEVEFFEGFEITVINLSEEEIVSRLVKKIEEETGHTPETLFIRVVSAAEQELIATELMKFAIGSPICPRRREPSSPSPDIDYVRSLAYGPPETLSYSRFLAITEPSPER